ncbi:MAG TPA: GlsB/YeaQ/YmgE family stress response membrane protein, partial [Clostridiales bacterium]|nr:GlsB/YeaQ/YmgE family stress response membrane protein [Clostridiales bacterium]
GVTGFNIWSIIVAVIGACVLLYIVNRLKGNESTKE